MKQFVTVLKFELNSYLKNKSFLITTLLLALALVGVLVVPTMIPGLLGDEKEMEAPKEDEEELERLGIFLKGEETGILEALKAGVPAVWQEFDSQESLKEAVREGEAEAGFVVEDPSRVTYVVMNRGAHEYWYDAVETVLTAYQKEQFLEEKGLTPQEIQSLEGVFVDMESEILGKDSARSYGYTYVLILAVYFLILFYGQMIAVSVTTEKSNRAIEILVTSVNPNSLIFGKVLAGAIAGALQMVLILGSAFGVYGAVREAWGGMLDFLFQIPARVLLAYVLFASLSYLLYAFLFGTLGALVSKTEDISKSATPIALIYVVSFLIAMMGLADSDSLMVKVASFVPFTSGNAMFIRISMGEVASWEILVSAAILLGACILTGFLAAKLFRYGTLHYGNPVKLTKALKNIRVQE
ncbi:MAG: ABC transporter permease [Eubacteriales bacterium]|nr:ABC transporter permease [Eubacteriales bacterium]